MKLAVLGGGAWGTAIAISLAARHAAALWVRDPEQARAVASTRDNARYLPGCRIPDTVTIHAELAAAVGGCELMLLATPTAGLRPVLQQAAALSRAPVLWLCKGFEASSARLPHQIAAEALPASGPGVSRMTSAVVE